MLRLAGILAVLLSAMLLTLTPSSACGCIEPMPDAELEQLISKASRGDAEAVGQVWEEYKNIRGDDARAEKWEIAAIHFGLPEVMDTLADDWMLAGQRSSNPRHKRLYYTAAIRLLENGLRHRRDTGGVAGFRSFNSRSYFDAYMYFNSLRTARAALATHQRGVDTFEARARKGDIDAAYHAAIHHRWVVLDQDQRSVWERSASKLGEPEFAGRHVSGQTKHEDIRDIFKALGNDRFIATLGDEAIRRLVKNELRSRIASRRQQRI